MMRFRRMFNTIDTHTGGEPTRTVIGGMPPIPGKTMAEKMLYLKNEEDWIRQCLMYEPRGNEVMSGVFLTEPCLPEADIGVIFMEVGGYLPMCGHDTIGVCTALIESGMIKPREPYTFINLDTPAGLVRAKVLVENQIAKEVSFTNIPSFVFARDVQVEVPELGTVSLDISYGGNYYAILDAQQVGLAVEPSRAKEIVTLGNKIKDAVNRQVTVFHPDKPFINEVTHVEFSALPVDPEATLKNAVVIPPGAIDRSPCGTGTSAKMAALYSRGQLAVGDRFVHESIIGSVFRCRVLEETKVGDFPAIIPEITGSAYVTGMHTFVIDPDDPFWQGFQLG
jgi:proline racemase